MGQVFFPLDEKLALLPVGYAPTLVEAMVRLGTRLPFAQVADELAQLLGVVVSADTVRRLTEEAGSYQVAIEQDALERLEREAPDEVPGPGLQQMSADGAMVSLTDGRWTEVRTIAIGTITDRDGTPHAEELAYFSRRCPASEFIRQATLPTHERGTRQAGTVVAISDGAEWLQALADRQCPDAVRILDYPHAVGYLSQAAQAAFGAGSREAAVWLDTWAPKLKTTTPEAVLAAMRALPTPDAAAGEQQQAARRYLAARIEQIRYARFREQGYPIGSGIVESAGKLVVQARLKGSGMHWAEHHLNPLLALRGRLCSGQWSDTWQGITQRWRTEDRGRRQAGRERRRAARATTQRSAEPELKLITPTPERVTQVVDGHPTDEHRWKRDALLASAAASA